MQDFYNHLFRLNYIQYTVFLRATPTSQYPIDNQIAYLLYFNNLLHLDVCHNLTEKTDSTFSFIATLNLIYCLQQILGGWLHVL